MKKDFPAERNLVNLAKSGRKEGFYRKRKRGNHGRLVPCFSVNKLATWLPMGMVANCSWLTKTFYVRKKRQLREVACVKATIFLLDKCVM